ncbi:carbohydrate kinase [Tepidanaerobacter syntrophicus]|uniref:L-xylulokinase n=1 Tax=Tepidanaerobacter syntrophicus TaxID=224999 RepID=A0A0U9HS67_9FIRM|nr:FGGY family carbohydrate kinase [Tepidanaerobacter syntrophicus]GAQ25911.1 L-xylulokinase [Tepidanaerobacter syntrophicus]GLI50472.1 carbohydrate kinase [Tepidanaerobacter syntrophicus]HHV82628.1 carbohydrate kinase [Tepidanaerobacter syntrophicus]
MKSFLCIDAGTTKIKAALTTTESELIDSASKDVKVLMPSPGISEVSMNEYWDLLCEVLEILYTRNTDLWSEICAVGVCAQGDGAWLLDTNCNPVRSAILWNDTRPGTIQKDELNLINQKCIDLNTTPLFSGAFPIILNWLKRHEPNNYKKVKWVIHCKDWINYKLTGNIATDVTDASTAAFDIFNKTYCYEILNWLDIDELRNCLPPVYQSTEVVGEVSESISKYLKIPAGTPVIAGSLDILAAAEGNCLMKTGEKGSILGTTLANFVVINENEAKRNLGSIGSVLCHVEPNMYIKQMSALSGIASLDWARNILAEGMTYAQLEEELKKVPIGSNEIIFLPYLFGERAPFRLANASGAFLGLRAYHKKYDMIRSAYEGIALALYDCHTNLPKYKNRLYIAGGGAQSDFLCQIICDCLDEPLVRNNVKELGILGISYLLQKIAGQIPKFNEQYLTYFYPNQYNHQIYMKIYERYSTYKNLMINYWGKD